MNDTATISIIRQDSKMKPTTTQGQMLIKDIVLFAAEDGRYITTEDDKLIDLKRIWQIK